MKVLKIITMFLSVRPWAAGRTSKAKMPGTSGYSLLEVMMAVVVSIVGLVSLLALFSQAVVTMFLVQEDLIAKQKTREALVEHLHGPQYPRHHL